ncbi:MAG TPA: hypothetical protein VMU92_13230 [Acidobacteriaceae bacterium]|nr:hypothetical protein [Acidobacteriaceae bacterium]
MKAKSIFRLCAFVVLLVAISAQSQTTPVTGGPRESKHQKGPNGLEGWTLKYTVPDHTESYSEILVISRKGHILRKIKGQPFIWRWMFQDDGRSIAYETGPLHFEDDCYLVDLTTGKQLATYDCYRWQPPNPPSWVIKLEKP